jgi:hypothetical protein
LVFFRDAKLEPTLRPAHAVAAWAVLLLALLLSGRAVALTNEPHPPYLDTKAQRTGETNF